MKAQAFDHVALWVDERDALATLLCDACGMHEIERTDAFTLVGGDARQGKLTLFAAEGPRERGVLERIVLRVPDLDGCRARLLPEQASLEERDGQLLLEAPPGFPLGLLQSDPDGIADLDHVVLRVPDPDRTAHALEGFGLERNGTRVGVGDRHVALIHGDSAGGERPLLNHLAFLVGSARDVQLEAEEQGIGVDRLVDAANTLAVFLRGPDGIALEYVEHKPSFSLV